MAAPASDNFLTALKGATAEFHAEALELMKANVMTTLEYAWISRHDNGGGICRAIERAKRETMRANPEASRHAEVTCADDNEVQC